VHQALLTVHVVRIEITKHNTLNDPVHNGQGESARNRVVAEDIGKNPDLAMKGHS
jgi:hypothetical protein